MKKLLLIIVCMWTLLFSNSVFAVDPKLKILGSMAGYGVVGGALMGAATMAFGTSGRIIAQGASLGLYGGLIFGSYVILSYEMKKNNYNERPREDYYPDSKGSYENEQSSSFFSELEQYRLASFENKKDPRKDPLLFVNFFHHQF